MMEQTAETSQRAYARFAGLMYFLVLGFDIAGLLIVSSIGGGGNFVETSLPGLQVGFPSQIYRCLVDDWLFWLPDTKFCNISFPQLQRECCPVYRLGGTVIALVPFD